MNKIIGIYKITNLINGRVYIGQSSNVEFRFNTYKKLQCKTQHKLYHSLKTYGIENHTFEVIKECEVNELNYYERHYQEFYHVLDRDLGLNLSLVSVGGKKQVHSDESKKKISEKRKELFKNGYVNPKKGTKASEESKKKMSISQKKLYENGYVNPMQGKNHSKESNIKNRESNKKLYENGYVNPNKGKKLSEELIKKNREAQIKRYQSEDYINPNIGSKRTEEQKENMKKNHHSKKEGYVCPIGKKVINLETNEIFISAKQAWDLNKDILGIAYPTFKDRLNGNSKMPTIFKYL
jgi:group I intron endonuclease